MAQNHLSYLQVLAWALGIWTFHKSQWPVFWFYRIQWSQKFGPSSYPTHWTTQNEQPQPRMTRISAKRRVTSSTMLHGCNRIQHDILLNDVMSYICLLSFVPLLWHYQLFYDMLYMLLLHFLPWVSRWVLSLLETFWGQAEAGGLRAPGSVSWEKPFVAVIWLRRARVIVIVDLLGGSYRFLWQLWVMVLVFLLDFVGVELALKLFSSGPRILFRWHRPLCRSWLRPLTCNLQAENGKHLGMVSKLLDTLTTFRTQKYVCV